MRRFDLEQRLCGAITGRRTIRFRYRGGAGPVAVLPYAVYLTEDGRICLAGEAVQASGKRAARAALDDFEVAGIEDLEVTSRPFKPASQFDSHGARFRAGVECAVDRRQDETFQLETD
jgi:hypothetical protein